MNASDCDIHGWHEAPWAHSSGDRGLVYCKAVLVWDTGYHLEKRKNATRRPNNFDHASMKEIVKRMRYLELGDSE